MTSPIIKLIRFKLTQTNVIECSLIIFCGGVGPATERIPSWTDIENLTHQITIR